jgi:hypothetical protein
MSPHEQRVTISSSSSVGLQGSARHQKWCSLLNPDDVQVDRSQLGHVHHVVVSVRKDWQARCVYG